MLISLVRDYMMLILCCLLDHRDLINARRRAAYRPIKPGCLDKHSFNGQSARCQSVCDITNVLEDREINKPRRDYHGW